MTCTDTFLEDYLPNTCIGCGNSALDRWPYLSPNSFILAAGFIRKVSIPVLLCTACGLGNYPSVTAFGLFPLHNKCLISVDYVLEVKNVLASGWLLSNN